MKRFIDMIMAGGGLGLLLLGCAIKAGKFGGEQFNMSGNQTTIMVIAGMLLFLLATASMKNGRSK